MLIECPNCATKYNLSSVALGSEGREMRCAKCTHEWFQAPLDISELDNTPNAPDPVESIEDNTPEPPREVPDVDVEEQLAKLGDLLNDETTLEEEFGEAEEDPRDIPSDSESGLQTGPDTHESENTFEDEPVEDSIPDSVKPTTEDVIAAQETSKLPSQGALSTFVSIAAAFILILTIPAIGLLLKDKIVKAAPFTAGLYNMVGADLALKGEGFVIESLNAVIAKDVDNTDYIQLEGRIINMTGEPMHAPKMLATLQSEEGKESESWFIDPPKNEIAPGESFTFTSDYPTVPEDTKSVNLTFTPEFDA